MTEIQIRIGKMSDQEEVAKHNVAMAWETESLKLDYQTVFEGYKSFLDHPEYGFYLIAEDNDLAIGQLMITYEWSDWRNSLVWWIQSVYVKPEYRKRGIYKSLYAKILEMAKDNKEVCGIRLYVAKGNKPAQKTYNALGMEDADYHVYEEMFTTNNHKRSHAPNTENK